MDYKFWFLLWEQVSINFRKKEKYFWHIGFSILKIFYHSQKALPVVGGSFLETKGKQPMCG